MLCMSVFIYIQPLSSFRAPMLWFINLLLLAIFNTLFWVYANFFHRKTEKTWRYSKSTIFVRYTQNGCQSLLGVQSINTERASLRFPIILVKLSPKHVHWIEYGLMLRGRNSFDWFASCHVNNFLVIPKHKGALEKVTFSCLWNHWD